MANGQNESNMQIKMIRTIIVVTATIITILSISVAVGVYRAEINNNSLAVEQLCEESKVTQAKAYSNEKDIIKIQSAVERTDERTVDIKISLQRIEDKLNKEP